MKVTYDGNTFTCARAYKGSDYVKLADSNGINVATFYNIRDFSLFTLTDGTWTNIPNADNCSLVTMAPDGTILPSDKKACDVAPFPIHIKAKLHSKHNIIKGEPCAGQWNIKLPDNTINVEKYDYVAVRAAIYGNYLQSFLIGVQLYDLASGYIRICLELSDLSGYETIEPLQILYNYEDCLNCELVLIPIPKGSAISLESF